MLHQLVDLLIEGWISPQGSCPGGLAERLQVNLLHLAIASCGWLNSSGWLLIPSGVDGALEAEHLFSSAPSSKWLACQHRSDQVLVGAEALPREAARGDGLMCLKGRACGRMLLPLVGNSG